MLAVVSFLWVLVFALRAHIKFSYINPVSFPNVSFLAKPKNVTVGFNYLCPRGGGPPVNTNECLLQGPRDCLVFMSRLCSRRSRLPFSWCLVGPRGGGFVCVDGCSRLVLIFVP